MDKRLLSILCCPVSHKALNLLNKDKLAELNAGIAAGRVSNHEGVLLSAPLDAALVTDDGKRVYPVDDGIPVLLEDAAIGMEQIA